MALEWALNKRMTGERDVRLGRRDDDDDDDGCDDLEGEEVEEVEAKPKGEQTPPKLRKGKVLVRTTFPMAAERSPWHLACLCGKFCAVGSRDTKIRGFPLSWPLTD